MKGIEFMSLPAGTRVRLRKIGYDARHPRVEDEIVVARIVNATRYASWNGRGYLRPEDITHDGQLLRGAGRPDKNGDHRLVQIEKALSLHMDPAKDQNAWSKGGALQLVAARDVIVVWTDEVENTELAERAARFAEREAATAAATERAAKQQAETTEALARILPVLREAGVRDPWGTPAANDRVFTVADMAAVIDHLTGRAAS